MTGTRNNCQRHSTPVDAHQALRILLETRSFAGALARLPQLSEADLVSLLRTLLPVKDEAGCRSKTDAGPPALPAKTSKKVKITPAILNTDGASRGNPGPSGAGFVLYDREGNILREGCRFLGEKTNNEAEYEALLAGLAMAINSGCRRLEVRADSQLMIRQLNGRYKVKNQRLLPLVLRVKKLVANFDDVRFVHVPRENNQRADRLANQAIDEKISAG